MTEAQVTTTTFIGIDGGGTKTTCVIGDHRGEILAWAAGESSNVQSKPRVDVVQVLTGLVWQVLQHSGRDIGQVQTMYLALAGSDRATDRQHLYSELRTTLGMHMDLVIDNDARAALAAGTWGGSGIVLIAGTGSVAYAYPPSLAEPVRVGGWGYLLGDEGSGFDIGRKGLAAVLQDYDGRGPRTEMTDLLCGELQLSEPREIITAIYGKQDVRRHIAALAKIVFKGAERADPVAVQILREAREQLLTLAEAACEGLSIETWSPAFVVSGGLFANASFQKTFDEAVRRRLHGIVPVYPSLPSVIGAFILALRHCGETISADTQSLITDSWTHLTKGGANAYG